ncbi:hypothetical protein BJ122_105103 [Rhodopseudomonas faecalis]|uniref:Ribbon-helix-helix CopG family protein n=1 Tax=Rhodopseudomonas faecalis TaxID=99655 RepID=A0A318TGL9_9BRAD|nr:hypothetical protein [Rhodopseudomonas faecalis]PYF03846.1 hypothetical protein BJ122_105103 [Rhodopseudomonas faecalis]
MQSKVPDRIDLNAKVTAPVTEEIADAIKDAARLQRISPEDFIRSAISDRLDRLGAPHFRLPILRRF